MDWRWWKLARDKGVKTSINPDAHSTRGLQDLFFGIRSARKGWLTKDAVINTQSLEEVEKTLQQKRERFRDGSGRRYSVHVGSSMVTSSSRRPWNFQMPSI